MDVFKVIEPTKYEVPFILSIPHSGTKIPSDKINFYKKDQLKLKNIFKKKEEDAWKRADEQASREHKTAMLNTIFSGVADVIGSIGPMTV